MKIKVSGIQILRLLKIKVSSTPLTDFGGKITVSRTPLTAVKHLATAVQDSTRTILIQTARAGPSTDHLRTALPVVSDRTALACISCRALVFPKQGDWYPNEMLVSVSVAKQRDY